MNDEEKTQAQLIGELVALRQRHGELEALVTHHQQIATSLQRSERQCQDILDNAFEGCFRSTPDGRYVMVNPAMARILGYDSPADAIVNITQIERQVYVDPAQRAELKQQLSEQGEVRDFEFQIYQRNGNILWLLSNVRVVYGTDTQVLYYEGVCVDITTRKAAEIALQSAKLELEIGIEERTLALRESNEQLLAEVVERQRAESALRAAKDQLEAALAAVPGIVSWISSDFCYLGVNHQLASHFNLTPADFVGRDIGFLGSSLEFNEFVQEFFASPAEDAYREVSAVVNGVLRSYLIVAQKYNRNQSAFTVGIDITDRKQATEALKQAEAKYRSIFENAVDGIFQTTLDGKYLSANPALARIYGYDSPEEMMAALTHVDRELYVMPGRQAEFVRLLQANGAVLGFESQVYCKDGSFTWISESARAVRDEQGNLLYYEGIVEDIADRKRGEEAIRQANEDLELRVAQRTADLVQANHQLIVEIRERQRIEAVLRSSEAELRALFAAMTDVISVHDTQGRYLKVVQTNFAGLSDCSLLSTELIGKTLHDILPPTLADTYLSYIQRSLSTGQTVKLEYSIPYNGQDIWFAASISPMVDSVICVARDITERKQAEHILRSEQAKSERLLLNILPRVIADRLKQNDWGLDKQGKGGALIADSFAEVTVLFADIVGFTELSEHTLPTELVGLLNRIFSVFDGLAEQHGLEKIKTTGDAYMVVGGLPHPRVDHAEAIADMALDMQQAITRFRARRHQKVTMRIGIHTGPVVAGVIGTKKFTYDLWGDTVNIASRMESQGIAGGIQVTAMTHQCLKERYLLEKRGATFIKGKGEMMTYWLKGKKPIVEYSALDSIEEV